MLNILNIPTFLTKDVKYFIISFSGFASSELSGSDLLELTPDLDQHTELACRGAEVVTCNVARVNWEVIMKKENILLPTGDLLVFRFVLRQYNTTMGQSDHTDLSLVYEGEGGGPRGSSPTPRRPGRSTAPSSWAGARPTRWRAWWI